MPFHCESWLVCTTFNFEQVVILLNIYIIGGTRTRASIHPTSSLDSFVTQVCRAYCQSPPQRHR